MLSFPGDRNAGNRFQMNYSNINGSGKISLNFSIVFKVDFPPLEYTVSIKKSS